jgi:hypothetical protein
MKGVRASLPGASARADELGAGSRRGPVLKAFGTEVFGRVDLLVAPTIRICPPSIAATDVDNGPPGTEQVDEFLQRQGR